jgi:hypothetical protein
MIELGATSARQLQFGLMKFIKIPLVFRVGFDKIMKTNLTKE